ncbi:hypothetical protein F5X68DRAFT_11478 [Plectosphaerella plurivora]|uniref:Infection structure specific protein n=1 Tax=Plectosphaerella plurivora TaxID=936078 RepID=A0A9P9AC71_9PEZI|nr:hypothetical protein F5X68DRAFT_11478 [Plectosphaerella plurivora]
MHPNTSLVLAALASSAAAQVNVVHVLEKLQVIPRNSVNAAADPVFARQQGSDEECNSSLSSIVAAMPTLPSDFIQYAITATEEAPSSCTLGLPLSFSKPIMDSITAFAHWGADKSQDVIKYMNNCNEQSLNDPDSPGLSPGDLVAGECSEGAIFLFTEGSTTSTVEIDSVMSELASEVYESMTGASGSGGATKTGSSPASGSATPTNSGAASDASSTDAEESAASGAAQSTGADGNGAARLGLTVAGAAMAGVAALFVSL